MKKVQYIKSIEVPFMSLKLNIYTQKKGRLSFIEHVQTELPDFKDDLEVDGWHFKNHIYVENMKQRDILFHELSHYLEWLYDYLSCTNESEFKACLMAYIFDVVLLGEEDEN